MNKLLTLVILLLIVGTGSWYVFSSNTTKGDRMMEEGNATTHGEEGAMMSNEIVGDDGKMMEEGAMMKGGSYEAYAPEKIARAGEGKVVLFFRASWCPTCRMLDADLKAHLNDIPSGLTILDVDYDSSTALKQKYGITYQHTLVQVDAQGTQITKWSGSPTLVDLVTKVI